MGPGVGQIASSHFFSSWLNHPCCRLSFLLYTSSPMTRNSSLLSIPHGTRASSRQDWSVLSITIVNISFIFSPSTRKWSTRSQQDNHQHKCRDAARLHVELCHNFFDWIGGNGLEFAIEFQMCARRDLILGPPIAVGQCGGDPKGALAANFHALLWCVYHVCIIWKCMNIDDDIVVVG